MNDYSGKSGVPFNDLSVRDPDRYLKKISQILHTGAFILSKEVSDFEKEFAAYLGAKYCIGVASGTDAMLLALRALGIKQNDEIIVPAFTFIATASPIIMLGARPIFVDIREDLPVIDEEKIEKAITKKTRAIVVVHLYGYPCNLEKIKHIAKKYNLPLIEDVAQAQGSLYKSKKVGSFGDISIFSFYPTKNLGAFGDAGAIVTSNKQLFKKLRLLRDHGQFKKYKHEILGYNSRLDTLQAAILRLKLLNLDKENNKKTKLAKMYNKQLSNLPVKLFFFNKNNGFNPALYLFVIRTNKRNQLSDFLKRKGITCMIHYPVALPDEKIFMYATDSKDYLNAREYTSSVLSLPFFSQMTKEQLNYIVDSISEFFINKRIKK